MMLLRDGTQHDQSPFLKVMAKLKKMFVELGADINNCKDYFVQMLKKFNRL